MENSAITNLGQRERRGKMFTIQNGAIEELSTAKNHAETLFYYLSDAKYDKRECNETFVEVYFKSMEKCLEKAESCIKDEGICLFDYFEKVKAPLLGVKTLLDANYLDDMPIDNLISSLELFINQIDLLRGELDSFLKSNNLTEEALF